MSTRRLILLVLLGLIVLGMLTGIAALLLPRNTLPEELLITIVISGLYALGLLVVFSAGPRMVRTRWVALGGAAASFGGYIVMVWFDNALHWETTDLIVRWSTVALVLAFAMAQRLMLVPLKPRVLPGRVAQRAGLIAGAVTAVMLAGVLTLEDFIWFEELYTRLMGIAAIVAAGGTIGTGIVWFFERKPEHEEPGVLGEGVPVSLTCPRCSGPIEARSNREARCEGCRLKVRVEVDEPRCACGYLLYQLTGDTCPECGKTVPEADRWAAPA
jgi:hypothetical protein